MNNFLLIYVIKMLIYTIMCITSKDYVFHYMDPYYMAGYCDIKITDNILK